MICRISRRDIFSEFAQPAAASCWDWHKAAFGRRSDKSWSLISRAHAACRSAIADPLTTPINMS